MEDKLGSSGGERTFSWWDIQDQNAKLPVKETSQKDLNKLLHPSKHPSSPTDPATSAAKGAFKMMNKMAQTVVGDDSALEHSTPVTVLVFKLLDMVKINDDFNMKHAAQGGASTAQSRPRTVPAAAPRAQIHQAPRQQPQSMQQVPPQAHRSQQQQQQQQQQGHRSHSMPRQAAPPPRQPQQQEPVSLMDFGDSPAVPRRVLHHTNSSPFPAANRQPAKSNESRAEKLKREYAQKQQTANRVWDPIDERWVEVDPKQANAGTFNGNGSQDAPKKNNVVGISLDAANAVGKSANVQAAVHKRVNEMRDAQQKALDEVREREMKKKQGEEEEDLARKQLEPKIKEWAEEHGKKKQLRALLASLHTILWPGANWKQISIGDVLDDGKVKRAFHKATLVVHPDKTHHLPPDQRFLSKRIFDALCQAKTEFDNGAK